jgi:predicted nucleic acid-binding protein
MLIYLDSTVVIYAVENAPGFGAQVNTRLAGADLLLVSSELARMECRIKPLRERMELLLSAFEEYFLLLDQLLPVSREVLNKAAELRARHRALKTPDAIHLAAALMARCDTFYTNDHRLDSLGVIPIEVVEE